MGDRGVVLPGKPERALKHEWNPKRGGPPDYRYCQGDWIKAVEHVVIDDQPFAEGALRMCYRMQVVKAGERHNVVAKVSKDPQEDRNTYFRDVQAQMCSKMWAAEYNARDVPKRVDFVPAYVYELVDRPGRPLIGVEEFVEGVFQKHNNNVGGTSGEGLAGERATPNAFSHFTWEASNGSLLVCDIQGVEDNYTDPQIHTVSGKGFGRGNLGVTGIKAFMNRHRCTHVCEFLHLSCTNNGCNEDTGGQRRAELNTPIAQGKSMARSGSNEDLGGLAVRLSTLDTTSPLPSPRGGGILGNLGLGNVQSPPPTLSAAPQSRSYKSFQRMLEATSPSHAASAQPRGKGDDDLPLVEDLDHHDDALMDAILDELDDI